MLIYKNESDTAIIILHEIYGINRHISEVCKKYSLSGFDVYCPNLLNIDKPFQYEQQEEAYQYFNKSIGFNICNQVNNLIEQLRPLYKKIILIGYSIGATIAWICSGNGLCDSMIGYYGSRIRDYLDVVPKCPSLLHFASGEKSFQVSRIVDILNNVIPVTAKILPGDHGFCDPYSKSYHFESAKKTDKLTKDFLL